MALDRAAGPLGHGGQPGPRRDRPAGAAVAATRYAYRRHLLLLQPLCIPDEPTVAALAATSRFAVGEPGDHCAEHAVRDQQLPGQLHESGSARPEADPRSAGRIPAATSSSGWCTLADADRYPNFRQRRWRPSARPTRRLCSPMPPAVRSPHPHHSYPRGCGQRIAQAGRRDRRTRPVPYEALRTAMPLGTNAYPGIMLISTDVPTQGLPAADAKDYGELLSFEAGVGQTPGLGNGQLPDGYLPITKANGLSAMAAYTNAAAGGRHGATVCRAVPGAAKRRRQPRRATSRRSPSAPSHTTAASSATP